MSAVLDDSVGFDEPAETTQKPNNDRNALVIAQDMTRVQNALSEFDRVAAGLAEIEARYPKDSIYEITTPKGMKDALEHRAAWRDPRIMVEKARKMAKAPLLALGKNVDARASWLTDKLREGEEPIDQLIKAEEARREEERQARINAEAGRVLAIQESLASVAMDVQIACTKSSAEIQALLDQMRSTAPAQEVFQEQIDQARAAWSAGITKLETAHKAKLWDEEQEAQRAAAEAERQRRLAAEDAERARVAAEQKAEAERLAAERAQIERDRAELAALRAQVQAPAVEPEAPKIGELQEPAADVPVPTFTEHPEGDQACSEHARGVMEPQACESATGRGTTGAPALATLPAASPGVGSMGAEQPADAGLAGEFVADTRPPITTGTLCARLGDGITLTAAYLQGLGFEPAPRPAEAKSGTYWREADFPRICMTIANRMEEVAQAVPA